MSLVNIAKLLFNILNNTLSLIKGNNFGTKYGTKVERKKINKNVKTVTYV